MAYNDPHPCDICKSYNNIVLLHPGIICTNCCRLLPVQFMFSALYPFHCQHIRSVENIELFDSCNYKNSLVFCLEKWGLPDHPDKSCFWFTSDNNYRPKRYNVSNIKQLFEEFIPQIGDIYLTIIEAITPDERGLRYMYKIKTNFKRLIIGANPL